MSSPKPATDPAGKEKNMDTIINALTGVAPLPPVSEHYASLAFDELLAALKASIGALTEEETAANTVNAALSAATYRDMKYAHASRGHMMALASNCDIREQYEGMIIGLDAGM